MWVSAIQTQAKYSHKRPHTHEEPVALKQKLHRRSMSGKCKSRHVQLDLSLHASPRATRATHTYLCTHTESYSSFLSRADTHTDTLSKERGLYEEKTESNTHIPRLLWHHTPPGTTQHPPADISSCSSILPFHTCSTTRQIMQQDCQPGIPPPHVSVSSLSLSLLSFLFSLTPPPSPSSILVSLITIQQTAAVESAKRWHTIPQSWNSHAHTHTHLSLSLSFLPINSFLSSKLFDMAACQYRVSQPIISYGTKTLFPPL